jgi:UDP-N-acetylmuramate dehydrogenase
LLVDAASEAALRVVSDSARDAGVALTLIGGGSNLVISDDGFDGVVARYCASGITSEDGLVRADAGAELQALVDHTIERRLSGLHTMTRIPGWVGGAVYGNAGAYGHSIHEFTRRVWYFDGSSVLSQDNEGCQFRYRESIFKRRKDWIILSVELELPGGEHGELKAQSERIGSIRDEKFPPSMRCAGSIFKNLLVAELPASIAGMVPEGVIQGGKVPSAWFLDQTGVRGMRRGDIKVADYHANLVYNEGAGTAEDLRAVIAEMKARVLDKFGLGLEEEVQFVGF